MRLDVYLTEKGFTKSRNQAAECIKSRLVSVNGLTNVKASLNVTDNDKIILLGTPHNYVGRGGLKLEHALDSFNIDVSNMKAVDIGASTGGFTDCLLKRGASRVLALDSGHGQLDPSLENDPRVISLEGFNARNLTPDIVGFEVEIAVSDVSFISQTLILEPAHSILKDGGIYLCLVKPQFECGTAAIGKNGIVKDKKHHRHALRKIADAGSSAGFSVIDVTRSPVTGGNGNIEFLMYMIKENNGSAVNNITLKINEVCL